MPKAQKHVHEWVTSYIVPSPGGQNPSEMDVPYVVEICPADDGGTACGQRRVRAMNRGEIENTVGVTTDGEVVG